MSVSTCDVFQCEEQWQLTKISEMHLATRVFGQKVPELHEDTESQYAVVPENQRGGRPQQILGTSSASPKKAYTRKIKLLLGRNKYGYV